MIVLNGWPGVGKLTIARRLAERIGARVLDNHTLLNPAEALFERSDPRWLKLRREVRALVLDHAAKLPPDTPLVATEALADDDWDRGMFADWIALAERRGLPLVPVVLDCDEDENARRLIAPGRAEALKLTRAHILSDLRRKHRLLRHDNGRLVELDVTRLSPDETAARIVAALPISEVAKDVSA